MSTLIKDLGAVSAYAYAVEKGYTGTEDEFASLMYDYTDVIQITSEARDGAVAANASAQEAKTEAQTASNTANEAANKATSKASEASASVTEAGKATNAAVAAKTAAETAQQRAETAQQASEDAQRKAEIAKSEAQENATIANSKASKASQYATTATNKASEASTSAKNAKTYSEQSQASATTANTKADEASASANSARVSADNAQQSATNAQTYMNSSSTSASKAQANAEKTQSDKEAVESAKSDVLSAVDNAQNYANSAQSASQAIQNMDVEATTLEPDSDATVEKTVDAVSGAVTLTYGIPKGQVGEKGDKGDTGDSGVYIGTSAPSDENVNVWIDSNGEPDDIIQIDDTLTQSGQAADANVTGDEINDLKSGLSDITEGMIPINKSDIVNAYPSTTIDSAVTFTSSTKTKTIKKAVKVQSGYSYVISIKNSASPSATTVRNAVICDDNDIVKQVIEITTSANSTFEKIVVANTDGYLYICIDKNYVGVWVKGGAAYEASAKAIVDESEIKVLKKYENLINFSDYGISSLPAVAGATNATCVGIYRAGSLFVLTGANTTGSYDIRVRLTGNLARSVNASGVTTWTDGLSLIAGHTYEAKLTLIDGSVSSHLGLNVYAVGNSANKGTATRIDNDTIILRWIAEADTLYNLSLWVGRGITLNNATYTLTLIDTYNELADRLKPVNVYSYNVATTPQGGVIYNGCAYIWSTNYSSGATGMIKIDFNAGTQTFYNLGSSYGHGNDMTVYNGKLYVCSMLDDKKIYIINPDTMEVESYVEFVLELDGVATTNNNYGIAYDSVNNQFLVAVNDGIAFCDTSFNLDHFIPYTYIPTNGTHQSIECDGEYIYTLYYKNNVVVVRDYDTNKIKEIPLTIGTGSNGIEPEELCADRNGGWWLISRNLSPSTGFRIDAVNIRKELTFEQIIATAKLAWKNIVTT